MFPMLQTIFVSSLDKAAIDQGQSPFAVVNTAQEGALVFLYAKITAWVGVCDDSFATSCSIFDFTDVCRFAKF